MLALRLRELEHAGIVVQSELPPPACVTVYRLTQWGLEFEPICGRLAGGPRVSATPSGGTLTPDAAILALRTMATGPPPTTPLAFDLGLHDGRAVKPVQTWYHLSWGPESLIAEKRMHQFESSDAVACDAAVWSDVLFGEADATELFDSDAMCSRGHGRRIAKRFVVRFRQRANHMS